MARKQSFFERLTGAINTDEDFDTDLPEVEDATVDEHSDPDKTPIEQIEETPLDAQLAVDVFQTPDDIIIRTMVAGVDPEDVDVTITREMVTIHGERSESKDLSNDDFFHQELYWGSFSRTILLPEEVDVEEAQAEAKNGLLIIKLPKIDKERQTKLKVKH